MSVLAFMRSFFAVLMGDLLLWSMTLLSFILSNPFLVVLSCVSIGFFVITAVTRLMREA